MWGNAEGIDNIVWGNTTVNDTNVWGSSDVGENVSWGNSAGDGEDYGDDTAEIESFDPSVWEDLFDVPLFTTAPTSSATAATTVIAPLTTSYVLGGGVQ